MLKNSRRRRVSRANKKKDSDPSEEPSETLHKQGDEDADLEEVAEGEKGLSAGKRAAKVELVQIKPSSSKRVKTSEIELSSSAEETQLERTEWGSKQPKPADQDVLKYALTTGGELARKANEVKTKSASLEKVREPKEGEEEGKEEGLSERRKAIDVETEEIAHLRNALFREVKEGEASLSCDKRGSRVMQGLVKEGTTEQALIDRCGSPEASATEKKYVSEFADQVNKANEWWAMMHDKSATHVARSLVIALKAIKDEKNLALVFKSLKEASQSDYRGASRNSYAGPFLSAAISSLHSQSDRETLVRRFLSDERNDVELDRKQFDSAIQDRIASRVLDQVVPLCSSEFVHDVMFEQGLVAPYLQRSAKHAFANFVVQRVIERLSTSDSLGRVLRECPVKEMIEFDRVGVVTSLVKALSRCEGMTDLRTLLVQEMVECDALERTTQRLQLVQQGSTSNTADKAAEKGEEANKKRTTVAVDAHVHLALSELVSAVFTLFPAPVRQPLVHQLLCWDASRLVSLSCDPVGGKKILEPLLECDDHEQAYSLAKRFKSNFAQLALDRFGVHVAKKAFHLLKKNDKIACMEDDILPGKSKLMGYPHGSKFLSHVAAAEFAANKKEWAKKMEAQTEAENKAKEKRVKESIKAEWSKELGI